MSGATAFDALLVALESILMAVPPVAGGAVGAARVRAVSESAQQAVDVRLIAARPDGLAGLSGPINYVTTVGVECMGRAAPGGVPDAAASATLAAAHARIAANQVALLAQGFNVQLSPELRWDREGADERLGVVVALYTVTHTVSFMDLT